MLWLAAESSKPAIRTSASNWSKWVMPASRRPSRHDGNYINPSGCRAALRRAGVSDDTDEEWRFTNVSSIAKTQFSDAPSDLNARDGAQLDPSLSLNEGGL